MVLDLLNDSFAKETTPKIDEIIGFHAEKYNFFSTYYLRGCVALFNNYPISNQIKMKVQIKSRIKSTQIGVSK